MCCQRLRHTQSPKSTSYFLTFGYSNKVRGTTTLLKDVLRRWLTAIGIPFAEYLLPDNSRLVINQPVAAAFKNPTSTVQMIALNPDCRHFLYREPVNINKSFYSLAAIVKEQMNAEPLSKDVFIFLNNRCTQLKLLVWQGDGFAIYHKRLDEGTFELPVFLYNQRHAVITYSQLVLILQGISLRKVHYRKRYCQQIAAR